jgi:hypothetical protein
MKWKTWVSVEQQTFSAISVFSVRASEPQLRILSRGDRAMKGPLIMAALSAALVTGSAAIAQTDGNESGQQCQTHVNTDKGDGGVQAYSCKDGEGGVSFDGPIRDVDWDHPFGKGKAFLPQAGRDAQKVVQDAGHNIEKAAHGAGHAPEKAGQWVAKRLGIHW